MKWKAWPDRRLVAECLKGNEEAWSVLVEKYKRLIYSIPVKYGFSPDEATDIFQAVCLELLSELPKLRKPEALPKWIIQVTSHKCFHGKREQAAHRYRGFQRRQHLTAAPPPAPSEFSAKPKTSKSCGRLSPIFPHAAGS